MIVFTVDKLTRFKRESNSMPCDHRVVEYDDARFYVTEMVWGDDEVCNYLHVSHSIIHWYRSSVNKSIIKKIIIIFIIASTAIYNPSNQLVFFQTQKNFHKLRLWPSYCYFEKSHSHITLFNLNIYLLIWIVLNAQSLK